MDHTHLTPVALRCENRASPPAVDVANPRLGWTLHAPSDATRNSWQSAYQIQVASSLEKLAADTVDLWDSEKTASRRTTQVRYDGQPLASAQQCFWRVRVWDEADRQSGWSNPAVWTMGILSREAWQARWIGVEAAIPHPAPFFRYDFKVEKGIRRAHLYATACGLYRMHINGAALADNVLAPEWTDYHRRIQYQGYDVTDCLQRGDNVIGACVGDGWYAGRIGITFAVPGASPRGIYGRHLALLAQLHIEFDDGEQCVIATDDGWRYSLKGPIRTADLLDGIHYDARQEMPGWDAAGFDDADWQPVVERKAPAGRLVAQANEPVRVGQRIAPQRMLEPVPGVYVFDLGQNVTGWVRLKLAGRRGQAIQLRHAEMLSEDGHIYTENLRTASQTDTYHCRGGGEEVFEPVFTYHGFQFVEVSGLSQRPALTDLEACAVWTSAPEAGDLTCSNTLYNQIFSNIRWTQRNNLIGVPTDCPQRDERMGWSADIQVFAQTGCFNQDLAATLTKWLDDFCDAQADDGRLPDFAPHPFDPNRCFSGTPGWGDAGPIVAWCLYRNYGDRDILRRLYEPTRRWIEWIHRMNPNLLWREARHNDYGEWLNADTFQFDHLPSQGADMPRDVLATAYFFRSTALLADMAQVLGRVEDAERYRGLADRIKGAFNDAYVNREGRIVGDTQAGYAIALSFGLLAEPLEKRAFDHMIRRFDDYDGHLSTGFIATVLLMNELTRRGRADLAHELLNKRTCPSWGYSVEQGATTVWERWDGFVRGKGFQDPNMNSFCHFAIGSVGEWMYRNVLGVDVDNTAEIGQLTVMPRPSRHVTWARGYHRTIHGRVSVDWAVQGDRLTLEVTTPANCETTIGILSSDMDRVRESGRTLREAPGLTFIGTRGAFALVRGGSGTYRFTSVCDPALLESADQTGCGLVTGKSASATASAGLTASVEQRRPGAVPTATG
ncbi:family 78 glycoside hydrolase catalytic domain [Phycisphaerales bacterium AB-hyl4]|uniref:alpha-L-rhamnosidase n=1 Tax=Natronomicrosphaera hydrolytica TaxID=3242702 RepID=A0ABV4U3C0_9BACT